ncbi:MAG: hypothetical protein AAEC10_01650, partial [Rhodospirillales bacterium]
KWTLFYLPAACYSVALPLFMMGGITRPVVALIVLAFGTHVLVRRARSGWQLQVTAEHIPTEDG